MKTLLSILMLVNAGVFVFGALQHAGVALGPFHEPMIPGATVVETICAVALLWGALSVIRRSPYAWRRAVIANLVVVTGVAIGMLALALRAGPRTASNDLYHRIMLVLAGVSLVLLAIPAGRRLLKVR